MPNPPVTPVSPYWFSTRRYGWGWGLPSVWQGWVTLGAFFALMTLAAVVYPPQDHGTAFSVCIAVLVAALVAVCFAKGAPPVWRWGK